MNVVGVISRAFRSAVAFGRISSSSSAASSSMMKPSSSSSSSPSSILGGLASSIMLRQMSLFSTSFMARSTPMLGSNTALMCRGLAAIGKGGRTARLKGALKVRHATPDENRSIRLHLTHVAIRFDRGYSTATTTFVVWSSWRLDRPSADDNECESLAHASAAPIATRSPSSYILQRYFQLNTNSLSRSMQPSIGLSFDDLTLQALWIAFMSSIG